MLGVRTISFLPLVNTVKVNSIDNRQNNYNKNGKSQFARSVREFLFYYK